MGLDLLKKATKKPDDEDDNPLHALMMATKLRHMPLRGDGGFRDTSDPMSNYVAMTTME